MSVLRLGCGDVTGSAKVLVASDAMTRGMDVEVISNVVNYDAPVYVKTYVHRYVVNACRNRDRTVVLMETRAGLPDIHPK